MFGKFLSKIDFYGHHMKVNYRGENTFTTKLGGLASLVTFLILLSNMLSLITRFVTKENQVESYAQVRVESIEMEHFRLKEQSFFVYASTAYSIPPRIGSWKMLNHRTVNF